MNKQETIYQTSLILAQHFSDCIERKKADMPSGIHSRILSHILHPELDFVAVGRSQEVVDGAIPYPEHIVPCATIIWESIRLLEEGKSQEEVAKLIAKHWKIVFISKKQAKFIDTKEA